MHEKFTTALISMTDREVKCALILCSVPIRSVSYCERERVRACESTAQLFQAKYPGRGHAVGGGQRVFGNCQSDSWPEGLCISSERRRCSRIWFHSSSFHSKDAVKGCQGLLLLLLLLTPCPAASIPTITWRIGISPFSLRYKLRLSLWSISDDRMAFPVMMVAWLVHCQCTHFACRVSGLLWLSFRSITSLPRPIDNPAPVDAYCLCNYI